MNLKQEIFQIFYRYIVLDDDKEKLIEQIIALEVKSPMSICEIIKDYIRLQEDAYNLSVKISKLF